MALSRSHLRCALCQGKVPILGGNTERFKFHLATQHDIFHEMDILIAINFLDDFEKEEIISRALPRMKVVFEGGRVSEKRCSEAVRDNQDHENKRKAVKKSNEGREETSREPSGYEDSSDDDNFEIVFDSSPGPEPPVKTVKTPVVDKEVGGEEGKRDATPEISFSEEHLLLDPSPDSRPESDPCAVRDSKLVVREEGSSRSPLPSASCEYCGKVMLRRNIRRHVKVKHGKEERLSVPVCEPQLLLYKCKICSTGLSSRAELRLHTSHVHTLDIQDLEAYIVIDSPVVVQDEFTGEQI